MLTAEGERAIETWQDLFGVDYVPGQNEGWRRRDGKSCLKVRWRTSCRRRSSRISWSTASIPSRHGKARPLPPESTTRQWAQIVATATFLGYRPGDDQSQSLGYETRNWFEVLDDLGAYPPTGKFPGVNDKTEQMSRTTPVLACRFPNGSVAIAPHFKDVEENWSGGFAENRG